MCEATNELEIRTFPLKIQTSNGFTVFPLGPTSPFKPSAPGDPR